MERKIKIFKSFPEQEEYHLEQMRKTSVQERLMQLYAMQQLTKTFHPVTDNTRRIIIRNGCPKS